MNQETETIQSVEEEADSEVAISDGSCEPADTPSGVKIPLVIRDPVHDLIRVDCPIAFQLIQTEPFQRLRRIKQLGMAYMVYPGAEHTRFNHSLGVYHLVQRAMDTIELNMRKERGSLFDENQRRITGLAALLHDLGHGPFSHQFERFADAAFENSAKVREEYDHEFWTREIIQHHPEVSAVLRDAGGQQLIDDVTALLQGAFQPSYLKDLVSSQLDMDRLDYLIRDSHFSGCKYGKVDLEWILRSLVVAKKKGVGKGENQEPDVDVLAVDDQRGRHCIEQYLIGRHFMNMHVYYHKVIVSVESMLERILNRALKVMREGKRLNKSRSNEEYPVLGKYSKRQLCSVDEYLQIDDIVVMGWILEWARGASDDPILNDLSRRLVNRQHFVVLRISNTEKGKDSRKKEEAIERRRGTTKAVLNENELDPEFYSLDIPRKSEAYKDDERKEIHVRAEGDKYARHLSDFPSVITEGGDALQEELRYLLMPRECRDEIKRRLEN